MRVFMLTLGCLLVGLASAILLGHTITAGQIDAARPLRRRADNPPARQRASSSSPLPRSSSPSPPSSPKNLPPVKASYYQIGSSSARLSAPGHKFALETKREGSVEHALAAASSIRVVNNNFYTARAGIRAKEVKLKMDLEPGAMAKTTVRNPDGFVISELHDEPGRHVRKHAADVDGTQVDAKIEMFRGLGKIKASGKNYRR